MKKLQFLLVLILFSLSVNAQITYRDPKFTITESISIVIAVEYIGDKLGLNIEDYSNYAVKLRRKDNSVVSYFITVLQARELTLKQSIVEVTIINKRTSYSHTTMKLTIPTYKQLN